MADTRGTVACDDRCGCPSPCDRGNSCRCMEHKQCSCGEHCGCNPCSCSGNSSESRSGKAFCKCGAACTCPTCSAP